MEVLADVRGGIRGDGPPAWAEPLLGAVENLCAAGDECYQPHGEVEAEEDCFLCGARGEAVHCVGARKAAAGELGIHLEAVQPPLSQEKANFCKYAEDHVDHVKPPQTAVLSLVPAANLVELGVGGGPLAVVMRGVHEENQGRCGDEDDVKHPESVLGDGEGHVVAHLSAARLEGVADKLLLLVIKQVAGYSSQDHNPEDKHEQEPETTKHRRVDLEAVEEHAEEAPFPHDRSAGMASWESGDLSASELSLIKEKPKCVLLCPTYDSKEGLRSVSLSRCSFFFLIIQSGDKTHILITWNQKWNTVTPPAITGIYQ